MRGLIYDNPYPIKSSMIADSRIISDQPGYYNKSYTIFTKKGIVIATELDWDTNTGKLLFTEFKTIVNGIIYSAQVREVRQSERCLKWLATNFISKIIKNPCPATSTTSHIREINL